MISNSLLLSVIIPVHRQEKTIIKDMEKIKGVLKNLRYDWEIIIVIDGKTDNSYQNLNKFKSGKTKLFQLPQNKGKGFAVRFGMQHAKGDYVLFLDAGMEIDPNGISMLMEHLIWYKADIIVGSKRHPVSVVNYPLERKILSWGYFQLVKILFGLKIKDTQPGIKIFRKAVLEKVLPKLNINRYAFDIEILAVARKMGFERIYEAPIKMDFQFNSLTNAATIQVIWEMFKDTLKVWFRLNFTKYYR